jgi:Cdc6-like AAA superfamily ATPase
MLRINWGIIMNKTNKKQLSIRRLKKVLKTFNAKEVYLLCQLVHLYVHIKRTSFGLDKLFLEKFAEAVEFASKKSELAYSYTKEEVEEILKSWEEKRLLVLKQSEKGLYIGFNLSPEVLDELYFQLDDLSSFPLWLYGDKNG